ncbi:MAG: hypothetical protein A2889_03855 [Nitrospinae bacterium RIFCSPLOWO2_01_FULL_39_10]|nr:MAG: hypothetical protein A2889_03855 [Nitrospinae bacterium RIFCSPLOWO2_01_FULL_39_10]
MIISLNNGNSFIKEFYHRVHRKKPKIKKPASKTRRLKDNPSPALPFVRGGEGWGSSLCLCVLVAI